MTAPLALAWPFDGPWRALNSPASRDPSHGTTAFASRYALDLVPVDAHGRSGPVTWRTLVVPEPPDRFVGYGQPVLSPVAGVVVATHDGEPDHEAHRGLPSLSYLATQGRRAAAGWAGLAGNHVVIRVPTGECVALAHLRRGSVRVAVGQLVGVGEIVGECGNSGNSTEPHLHLQAMTGPDPATADPVPFTFSGGLPRNGQVAGQPRSSASGD